MSTIRTAAVSVWMLCVAVAISSCSRVSDAPAGKPGDDEVKAAQTLLESWNGQEEVLEQSREILSRVLAKDPRNPVALREMARYQIKAGYINDTPQTRDGNLFTVGNFEPGTLETAETLVRTAIGIDPRFAEGYVLLGHIHFQQLKFDESARSLTQAETIGTDDPWLQLNWAELHAARGEHAAAEERWRRVLQSGTSNVSAVVAANGYLRESYTRAGRHEDAVALYREQIKLDPGDAWLQGNFADYLSETLGRHDEAIAQARSALRTMNYGIGHRILGMALYRKWADLVAQGKNSSAEEYFREALENYPDLDEVMAYGASVPGGDRLTKALIAEKGVSVDATTDTGSTALLIATNTNRADVVRMLLELGADPNKVADSGWTPLLSAADEGNHEIVTMLLAKGADIRAKIEGWDAPSLAEQSGRADLAALLRREAEQAGALTER